MGSVEVRLGPMTVQKTQVSDLECLGIEKMNWTSQLGLATVIQIPPSCAYSQSDSHALGHYTLNIDR